MRKFRDDRACNIILRALIKSATLSMTRDEVVSLLKTTKYASTAASHAIAYVNDANKYHVANIKYVKSSRNVVAIRIEARDAMRFNSETGFALTSEQIAARNEAFLESLASMTFADKSESAMLAICDNSAHTRFMHRVAAKNMLHHTDLQIAA